MIVLNQGRITSHTAHHGGQSAVVLKHATAPETTAPAKNVVI